MRLESRALCKSLATFLTAVRPGHRVHQQGQHKGTRPHSTISDLPFAGVYPHVAVEVAFPTKGPSALLAIAILAQQGGRAGQRR